VNSLKNAISAIKKNSVRELNISRFEEADFAILKIEDTGSGLADKSIEQLQEPFHTTKASGEGMGLGLAISVEIIKEHGGQLLARNRKNVGAVFTLRIPLSDEKSRT